MTGTGTQNDPFIVDNWPDFVTAIGTADAYVEFPEGGGTINVSSVYPTGIPETTIACTSIKGNDWILKNIYCKGHRGFSTARGRYVSIDKLHFLDFYYDDEGRYMSGSGGDGMLFGNSDDDRQGYYFNQCQFSGIVNCSYYNLDVYRRNGLFEQSNYWNICRLLQCSINVQLNGYAVLLAGSNYAHNDNRIEFCNIKVSGTSTRWTIYGDYRNCYITGISPTTYFDCNYGSANWNIINADFTDASSFECWGRSGEGIINFVNTDLLPDGATIGTGFVGVTTEQLQDASYLSSLGFPIGVES